MKYLMLGIWVLAFNSGLSAGAQEFNYQALDVAYKNGRVPEVKDLLGHWWKHVGIAFRPGAPGVETSPGCAAVNFCPQLGSLDMSGLEIEGKVLVLEFATTANGNLKTVVWNLLDRSQPEGVRVFTLLRPEHALLRQTGEDGEIQDLLCRLISADRMLCRMGQEGKGLPHGYFYFLRG